MSDSAHRRPVFLEPLKIALPIGALTSITHRLSGLFLIFALPLVLIVLNYSLQSSENFLFIQKRLQICWIAQTFAWGTVSAWIFHSLAGVRHLLMDCHLFDSLRSARRTGFAVFFVSVVLSMVFGKILWV